MALQAWRWDFSHKLSAINSRGRLCSSGFDWLGFYKYLTLNLRWNFFFRCLFSFRFFCLQLLRTYTLSWFWFEMIIKRLAPLLFQRIIDYINHLKFSYCSLKPFVLSQLMFVPINTFLDWRLLISWFRHWLKVCAEFVSIHFKIPKLYLHVNVGLYSISTHNPWKIEKKYNTSKRYKSWKYLLL